MSEAHVTAIFLLAGIPVRTFHELANNYWPDCAEYAEERRNSPWWLAETDFGLVRIGWRKRVISIEWESTPVRGEVTTDDVTKSQEMVHAWNYAKAVEYLSRWRRMAQDAVRQPVPATETSQRDKGAEVTK